MPYDGLQINEDLAFQHRSWRIQRAGWIAMGLLLLTGLTGFWGQGPFSWGTAGHQSEPLQVEYERLTHYMTTATLRLHVNTDTGRDRTAVRFTQRYADTIQIEQIMPRPEFEAVSAEGLTYVFRLEPGRPSTITFYMKMGRAGLLRGEVRIDDRPSVLFRQFVFP